MSDHSSNPMQCAHKVVDGKCVWCRENRLELLPTDNPAKAPEPDMRPSRVYAREALAAELAEENFAVPAQVAPYKCNVPECTPNTYCHECVTHLKDGMGHQFYCSKAATEPAAQPVPAPSPEITLPDLDHLEYLAKGGFLFTHKEVIPLLSALRTASEEFAEKWTEAMTQLRAEREARKQEAVEQFNAGRKLGREEGIDQMKAAMRRREHGSRQAKPVQEPVSGSPER